MVVYFGRKCAAVFSSCSKKLRCAKNVIWFWFFRALEILACKYNTRYESNSIKCFENIALRDWECFHGFGLISATQNTMLCFITTWRCFVHSFIRSRFTLFYFWIFFTFFFRNLKIVSFLARFEDANKNVQYTSRCCLVAGAGWIAQFLFATHKIG